MKLRSNNDKSHFMLVVIVVVVVMGVMGVMGVAISCLLTNTSS